MSFKMEAARKGTYVGNFGMPITPNSTALSYKCLPTNSFHGSKKIAEATFEIQFLLNSTVTLKVAQRDC